MDTIMKPVPAEHCRDLANILMHAYPGPSGITEESITKLAQTLQQEIRDDREPSAPYYGAYRNGTLLGAVKLHQFQMNLRGSMVRLGGIAGVCVHFLHKKEKVSRDMLAFALKHFHAEGIPIAGLYPFDAGFYKAMGFGYGALKQQYRIRPAAFPRKAGKEHIVFLTKQDRTQMLACYNRFIQSRTGMFARRESDVDRIFDSGHSVVGVRRGGEVTGYLSFRFQRMNDHNPPKYDMVIDDFIYNEPEALDELCAFLHSQIDQIQRVVIHADDDFHFLLHDPTNGRLDSHFTQLMESSVVAVGAMYRVIDVKKIF
jgi:predicted acetyltransferase